MPDVTLQLLSADHDDDRSPTRLRLNGLNVESGAFARNRCLSHWLCPPSRMRVSCPLSSSSRGRSPYQLSQITHGILSLRVLACANAKVRRSPERSRSCRARASSPPPQLDASILATPN